MRRWSIAVRLIILMNFLVFLAWMFPHYFNVSQKFMAKNFLVSWDALIEGRYWVLLTSEFSHNLWWHCGINMLVLSSFGTIVETTLGSWRFVRFYVIAAVLASIAHAVVSAFVMHHPDLPALGASGAVAGVILLFSLMYPREKILLFAFIPMPAIVGALFFVGLDVWGLVSQVGGGGLPIGHGAHLGGAIYGLIYYLWLRFKPNKA